jgi:hypothetical protein
MNDVRPRCAARLVGLRCQLVAGHSAGHAARDHIGLQIWRKALEEPFPAEFEWAEGFEPPVRASA